MRSTSAHTRTHSGRQREESTGNLVTEEQMMRITDRDTHYTAAPSEPVSPSPCSFHIIWFHVLAASNPPKTIYTPKCTKRLTHTCMQNLACSAWFDCLVLTRNLIPPPAHCAFGPGHVTFASSTVGLSPLVLAAAVYYCHLSSNLCRLLWHGQRWTDVTKST